MIRGSGNANAKLTDDAVRRIVHLRKKHGWGADRLHTELGEDLGVTRDTIRSVLRGSSWTHITGGPLIAGRKPWGEQ